MSDERGEGSGTFSLLLLLLALPLGIGVCSTGAFLAYRASSSDAAAPPTSPATHRPAAAPAAPVAPPHDGCGDSRTACFAALHTLEVAGQGDRTKLRPLLTDASWLDRLPRAGAEQGKYLVRALLGHPPTTLEELSGPADVVVKAEPRTSLDGESATVEVVYERAGEKGSRQMATFPMKKIDGIWTLTPPP